MKKDFMDDGFLIKDVMDTTEEIIERAFANPDLVDEFKGPDGGRELLFNMIFIRSLGEVIGFYEFMYGVSPKLVSDLPTEDLLNSFRKIIDGIEETFKAKDKELEVYEQ